MGIVGGTRPRWKHLHEIDYPLTPPGGLPKMPRAPTDITAVTTPRYSHYYALKNTLEHNGIRSVHYNVLYPPPTASGSTLQWNKSDQTINMISIPKIFYGSRIQALARYH